MSRADETQYRVGESPWCKQAEVPVDLRNRGLLLGDGVFDTALACNARVFRSADHLERLAASCDTLGIPIEREHLASFHSLPESSHGGPHIIRVTVTAGVGPRGVTRTRGELEPFVFASYAPADASRRFAPISLSTSTVARNDRSPASRLKMLGYQDALFGCWQVRKAGADEPLFLNTRGRVACTATCNLFVLSNRILRTPPLVEGVLDGVSRRTLLERFAKVRPGIDELSAVEAPIEPGELLEADAVYATNSLRLLSRVSSLDGIELRSEPRMTDRIETALLVLLEEECGNHQ